MTKFASPHGEKLYNYVQKQPDMVTPLNGCHERAHMSLDDFERGLGWLIHFGYLRKVTDHGRVVLEILK